MLRPFDNNLPRRLRFGRAVTGELAGELRRLGCSRPYVISDPGVVRAGILSRIVGHLEHAGLAVAVYSRTEPEPPFACVSEALKVARGTFDADVVIALGGGSVMDTAKLVAATFLDGREAASLAGIGRVGRRPIPLLCIPTTSGTGSEATPVAIFTDPKSGNKVGVVDPCLVPDVVLLDPELTDGLPSLPTAAAGMDAVVHALEAFIATTATPLARGLALEAARRLGPALPEVCKDGRNQAARDAMLLGANLAGLAFANSSCCAVHALALPLGGRFHIAHGVVTGCLTAETMRHNLPLIRDDLAVFAAALGWNDTSPDQFPDRVAALVRTIGLAEVLSAANVPKTALEEMAKAAVSNRRLMDPNPRPITETDAVEIYRRALGLHA